MSKLKYVGLAGALVSALTLVVTTGDAVTAVGLVSAALAQFGITRNAK